LPFVVIGVFKKGSKDPISLNTTNEKGYIMLTGEFMQVNDGDELTFVTLSQNYSRAEQTIKFSLLTQDYAINLVSALAKMIQALFKIKAGCPGDLATTMIVVFSNGVKKDQKNMTNCEVTFEFSESSNILGKDQVIEYNAFAYGY